MGFFQGTQERVRNSHGKRAINVRGTEVLLYFYLGFSVYSHIYKITVQSLGLGRI